MRAYTQCSLMTAASIPLVGESCDYAILSYDIHMTIFYYSACVSSQDPYCGYSINDAMCVSMHDTNYSNHTILQDIDNGNSIQCPVVMATATPTPSNTLSSTAVQETSVEYTTVCSDVYITTTVFASQDVLPTIISYYQPRSTGVFHI